MKIRLFLSAIALCVATISFGQSEMSSDTELKQKAMDLTEEMTTYLDLSDTQVERFKVLNYSFMKKKEEFVAADMSDKDRAAKIKAYEERHTATVKQILDQEQFEKFQSKYSEVKMEKANQVKKK
ncbi:MAG: hypothetical protein AAGC47_00365 [Bacteroidota bacterium]